MQEEILKGNFKVKRPIDQGGEEKKMSVQEELRERALASLGGSMVYMERTNFTWDGEPAQDDKKGKTHG